MHASLYYHEQFIIDNLFNVYVLLLFIMKSSSGYVLFVFTLVYYCVIYFSVPLCTVVYCCVLLHTVVCNIVLLFAIVCYCVLMCTVYLSLRRCYWMTMTTSLCRTHSICALDLLSSHTTIF